MVIRSIYVLRFFIKKIFILLLCYVTIKLKKITNEKGKIMSTKDIKNKKQNLSFMLLVILLVSVILCISSFGIATWARSRSVTGGNVEAQIAKWSFKVNGEEDSLQI